MPDSENAQSIIAGIDVGGTGIKMGRFDQSGTLLGELEVPTPKPATPGAITSELVKAIAQLDPQRDADAVGIGLPGPMDRSGRVAQVCINLPGWEQVPLAAWLEPRLQRPVTMANDGNCAVLGEQWLGAASGIEDVVMLTLGTGVGGGVILGGELFLGRSGAAAEPGLIGLDPMGPSCNSGNNGSIFALWLGSNEAWHLYRYWNNSSAMWLSPYGTLGQANGTIQGYAGNSGRRG